MKISHVLPIPAVVLGSCGSNGDKATATAVEATDSTTTTEAVEAVQPASDAVVIELGENDTLEPTTSPIVIDFSATWCGPCQQFKPTYHKVAEEYSDKAIFASADVDVCKALAEKYNVQSIPYILVLKLDGTTESVMGNMSEAEFKAFLDKAL